MSLPTTMIVCLIVSCLAAVPAYFVVRRAGGVMRTTVAYLLGFFVGAAMALIPTFVFQASKLDLTESSLGAGLAGAIIGPFTGISWAKHKRKINVTRRDDGMCPSSIQYCHLSDQWSDQRAPCVAMALAERMAKRRDKRGALVRSCERECQTLKPSPISTAVGTIVRKHQLKTAGAAMCEVVHT